jgi:hypothetical protein
MLHGNHLHHGSKPDLNLASHGLVPCAHYSAQPSDTKIGRSFRTLVQILAQPLEDLQNTAVEAALPIFHAAAAEVEGALLDMHTISWAGEAGRASQGVMQASSYMRRLERFLRHFRKGFLCHFVPQPAPNVPSFAALLCHRLAARALLFFVRLASLIKPLDEQGRLQLAKVWQLPRC